MSDDDKAFIAGAVASTLYLGGVLAGGLVLHVKAAWVAALASIACCYLEAFLLPGMKKFPLLSFPVLGFFAMSLIIGALAGIFLLIGG